MTRRRSILRWLATAGTVSALGLTLSPLAVTATHAPTSYTVYNSPTGGIDGSEIVDITPDNRYALVVGKASGENDLYVATVDPASGLTSSRVVLPSGGLANADPTSVAIHPSGKFAMITIRDASAASDTASEQRGLAVIVSIGVNGEITVVNDAVLTMGIHPESVDIAPTGEYAIVANEGTKAVAATGSVYVIDLNTTSNGSFAGASIAKTLEPTKDSIEPDPEAVAISPDGRRAYVTLQSPGDIMVINVDAANLASSTQTTVYISQSRSHPDGIAVTPDSQYVITANEKTNLVIMYQIGGTDTAPTLQEVASDTLPASGTVADPTPEMVAVGLIGGRLKAAVSLERTDSVAIYNLDLSAGATSRLQRERIIALNPGTQIPGQPAGVGTATARGPEGVAIATISSTLSYIVTANAGTDTGGPSENISVIVASTPAEPTPTKRIYLPILLK